ncbi:uncharacterized protein B0P05DRAFT_568921 [Gilbertella persicaria]|uniref:uncharacterized protein n=1 Tax=Gilbertella persicaria TaxID=101096 RepID=UPI002220AD6C|nr:uncharacterized protein B0P05DRAFT_568921 [Gilbertella persicaria]KAI8090967.1 hypothetical protein B0P05DRAFT_568921 [Gilbertella persicaria]
MLLSFMSHCFYNTKQKEKKIYRTNKNALLSNTSSPSAVPSPSSPPLEQPIPLKDDGNEQFAAPLRSPDPAFLSNSTAIHDIESMKGIAPRFDTHLHGSDSVHSRQFASYLDNIHSTQQLTTDEQASLMAPISLR